MLTIAERDESCMKHTQSQSRPIIGTFTFNLDKSLARWANEILLYLFSPCCTVSWDGSKFVAIGQLDPTTGN